jgi:hypothetical protein
MNPRIREFINQMDQAGLPYGDNAMTVTDRDLEYFAQLIIQECATLTLDHRSDDYYQGWLDYRDEIRQHFGVKE